MKRIVSMAEPAHQSSTFSGFKVLRAALAGTLIGMTLAFFLDTFIRNTPADLSGGKLFYLYGAVIVSATLFSTSVESVRQLELSALDGEYQAHMNVSRNRRKSSD